MRPVVAVALGLAQLVAVRAAAGDGGDARGRRVEELLRRLESRDAAARAEAATALGSTFPEGAEAVIPLIDVVEDDDASVRRAAVVALRRLGRAGQDALAKAVQIESPVARTTLASTATRSPSSAT